MSGEEPARLSLRLSGELAVSVREAVASGDYASTTEVLRDALRLWREKRAEGAGRSLRTRGKAILIK